MTRSNPDPDSVMRGFQALQDVIARRHDTRQPEAGHVHRYQVTQSGGQPTGLRCPCGRTWSVTS